MLSHLPSPTFLSDDFQTVKALVRILDILPGRVEFALFPKVAILPPVPSLTGLAPVVK